jgi:hypothetical protein
MNAVTASDGFFEPHALRVSDQFLPEAEAGVIALVASAVRCRLRALHHAVISDEVDELGGVAFQKRVVE